MSAHKQIVLLCLLVAASEVLGSSDDRFIKKYAMMKIYESCFGPEVVKQIRQEMKDACAKCAAAPSLDLPLNPNPATPLLGKLPPGFAMDPNAQTFTKPNDNIGSLESQENDLPNGSPQDQPPLNVGKLTQTIMAFRPQAPSFQPQQPSGLPPPYMVSPQNQYRPFSAATPFYQLPYSNLGGPNLYYPGNLGYNPYTAGQYQTPYSQPQGFYQQPYFGAAAAHRMSRDLDLRDRFDMLTQHGVSGGGGGGRARNITCVMQELGYLDHNMEPNYEKITSRIANLPVSAELKGDIQDGLQFCHKFAQCVPDVKKDVSPLSKELIKPMFFFRCYKHKKLEACIMKDIRERFTSEDDLDTETDFRSLGRSGKSLKDGLPASDPQLDALDEMSVYLYDFLSGSNNFDFDLYM